MARSFDSWLTNLESDGDGRDQLAAAVSALRELPSLAPYVARIVALLCAPFETRSHQALRDALCAGARADDAALRAIVAALVAEDTPRHAALEGVLVGAAHASQSPALAGLVAVRARRDRGRLPADRVPSDSLAAALARSRAPLLAATAQIEFLHAIGAVEHERWAAAVVGTAGVDGKAWLADHADWPDCRTAVAGAADRYVPIEALTATSHDLRARSLAELHATPRSEHLAALTLALRLDDALARTGHARAAGRLRFDARWLQLASALLPSADPLALEWASLDVAALVAGGTQRLTADLAAIQRDGADAVAARFARPDRSTELAALEPIELTTIELADTPPGGFRV